MRGTAGKYSNRIESSAAIYADMGHNERNEYPDDNGIIETI
jgi:hypothetical protein